MSHTSTKPRNKRPPEKKPSPGKTRHGVLKGKSLAKFIDGGYPKSKESWEYNEQE
jgi:hypothetical protein